MRIGILTSGGDAPGMNAAIRAAFRAIKMRTPSTEIIFFRDGFTGLAGRLDSSSDRNVNRKMVRDVLHRGGTFLGTGRVEALKAPADDDPNYDDRMAERSAFLQVAAVNLYQTQLDALIVIGGDGSFKGGSVIAEHFREAFPKRKFRIVGIPATIDNDIACTEVSIGYDTALNNTVDAIRKIRDTVESHKRGIILEVMGNTSGWLALQAAIAGGASTVAIPEIPETWDHDGILERLHAGLKRDYRYFIIVVAEGVRERAGRDWSRELRHRMETSEAFQTILDRPMEVRINSVGHVARGGRPSAFDNFVASRYGAAAADEILNPTKDGDVVVGISGDATHVTDLLEVVANSPRLVTVDSPIYKLSQLLMLQKAQPF